MKSALDDRVSLVVRLASALVLHCLLLLPVVASAAPGAEDACAPGAACPFVVDAPLPGEKAASAGDGAQSVATQVKGVLLFFWGVGCSHCEAAKPFVRGLATEFPNLEVQSIEVRKSDAGRGRFLEKIQELGIQSPGIPAFIYGQRFEIGFRAGYTEARVRKMLLGEALQLPGEPPQTTVELPWLGSIHSEDYSLPVLTLLVGLVDGINPCAMWVLLVLLGVMMHVRSRVRMALVGGLFVFMSGLVYFLFMTVWVGVFRYAGLSRSVTLTLGVGVLAMGLINLKELLWFKRGPSLTIPDKVKPALYRRMRAIANAGSLPAAVVGIAALAFLVNLVELGCTIGLPAVYSRLLSAQVGLSGAYHYAYLALYNVAYVVPLAVIAVGYVVTLRRVALSKRGTKVLKGISGVMLVTFGLIFIAKPELLG